MYCQSGSWGLFTNIRRWRAHHSCRPDFLILLIVSQGLVPTEHGGILWNLQGPMCKKHQITYRYFMFGWLKVKKSPGGLKKPHNNHGGKIWFSLVKNVNISRQLCSDWLKMWHSPWFFFKIPHTPWYDEILSLFSYIMGSKYGFYKKWANLTAIGRKSDFNRHPSHPPSIVLSSDIKSN